MAIIDKTIGNLTGKWDDEAEKWVKPPKVIEPARKAIVIDRNLIVMAFASLNKLNELDAWIDSSKTVESYFSTENISVDALGLQLIQGMISSAVTAGTISSEVADLISGTLNELTGA